METFGLVTVEAMACGAPVVAYDNTGSSEIVVKDCGALVEDGNYQELTKAVKSVLENGREYYSDACVQWVKDKFDKDTQIGKYVETYKTIIEKHKEEND